MSVNPCPYGYAIDGPAVPQGGDGDAVRQHVHADAAFRLACRNETPWRTGEAYLSAFHFPRKWLIHCRNTIANGNRYGGTEGYAGPTCSSWLWWDFDDAANPAHAKDAAGLLATFLITRYDLAPDDLLLFTSGSKGYHLGLPAGLFQPTPDDYHHKRAEAMALHLADVAGVPSAIMDRGVYDRSRAFRAPNSRHAKTGRHKVRLPADELGTWTQARVDEHAAEPRPFAVPAQPGPHPQAIADWNDTHTQRQGPTHTQGHQPTAGHRPDGKHPRAGTGIISARTWDLLQYGAMTGDRHHALYLGALNLAEHETAASLAAALLERVAHDAGLDDAETYVGHVVRRAFRRASTITNN